MWLDGLVSFLQDIKTHVATTRDAEAVAAEEDQVHADKLAETAEADRLRKLAERQTREAVQDKAEARGVVVSPR
jgi:hypothetical protein